MTTDPSRKGSARAQELVDPERVLDLERALIRIPSSSFEEQAIADYLAEYMAGIGLDVEMMDVTSPRDPSVTSRQPIGRLPGAGGGPSLMLNGHMDPGVEMSGWSVDPYGAKFEDGWIWGMGAHDDKGGIAAMVSARSTRSSGRARGSGGTCSCARWSPTSTAGAGTRALLAGGVTADLCINLEHSANTIANVCVGIVMARVLTTSPDLFFRFSPEARAEFWNPVEQQGELLRRIGPSLTPAGEDSWMTFTPHPDLPGFPMHNVDVIHKEHYYQPNHTGLSSRGLRARVPGPDRAGTDGGERAGRPRAAARRHRRRPPRVPVRPSSCRRPAPNRAGVRTRWRSQRIMRWWSTSPRGTNALAAKLRTSEATGASATWATETFSPRPGSRASSTARGTSASTASGRPPTSGSGSTTSWLPRARLAWALPAVCG